MRSSSGNAGVAPRAIASTASWGDPEVQGHARMRPPLELRLPPRPDRDDGHLQQPTLDRRLEPQRSAEPGEAGADAGREDPRVERAHQRALLGGQRAGVAAIESQVARPWSSRSSRVGSGRRLMTHMLADRTMTVLRRP